ncbi:MAG: NAD(P)-dependent oxidoreductase [Planctomycetota bacterium]
MTPSFKPRVLLATYYDRAVIAPALDRLRARADVVDASRGRSFTLDEVRQALPGIHVSIAADEPYPADVLEQAPDLLLIARDGTGFESIDLAAATAKGIVVTRAPVVHFATANFAIGLIIALVRKIPFADRAIRENRWTDRAAVLCQDLTGMTLGIVGFGVVGREVASRAAALGMKLLVYDVADVSGPAYAVGAALVSLDELLAACDVVTVHIRHTEKTRHLFSADLFRKMKKGAYFVNTSRGGIVREADLIDALASGRLAGAALDVFESEPVNSDNPLLRLPNVVLTPHVAGDTSTTMLTAIDMNVTQILDLLAGRKPSNLLNPDVWPSARFRRLL